VTAERGKQESEGWSEFVYDLDDVPNSEIQKIIDEFIHSERDRKIMKRRLIDGICFEPLSWEFDLSVTQTKNIVYRLEKKIFKHLKR
jgi:hypothetical protein